MKNKNTKQNQNQNQTSKSQIFHCFEKLYRCDKEEIKLLKRRGIFAILNKLCVLILHIF